MIFPAVAAELLLLLELAAGRRGPDDAVLCSRRGMPLSHRSLACAESRRAAKAAGLGKVTPKAVSASYCSLAGRGRVDPVEAAQLTGHLLNVWTRYYARSFGKVEHDEARARMLEHGFGAVDEVDVRL